MEVLRSDFLKDNTLKYRALLLQHDRAVEAGDTSAADSIKKEMGEVKRKCPAVVCQVTLEGGKDKSCITAYTGYVMVDLDHVPADRMKEVFGVVAADAHTFVAYTTISGRGIRVIARVEDKVTEENTARRGSRLTNTTSASRDLTTTPSAAMSLACAVWHGTLRPCTSRSQSA